MNSFETTFEHFTDFALAYQAVTGESFCESAWLAFMLQLRHAYKFLFAEFVSKLFILLGKVGITALSVMSCHYVMKNLFEDLEDHLDQDIPDPKITDETASLVVVGVFSFMIASTFLGVL